MKFVILFGAFLITNFFHVALLTFCQQHENVDTGVATSCRVYGLHRVVYRSTSPNTISKVPMMATTSANMCLRDILSSPAK